MTQSLTVAEERGRRDRKAFLGLPYRLHRGQAAWVAPLRLADAELMNRRRNPFFATGSAQHFLARRGDRVVGRIAAACSPRHNEFHGDRLGFFGWFDAEDDPDAARALVAAARAWVEARGLAGLRGPYNYTSNDTCGVLVEGHALRPYVQMPWNPPYYDALLRGAGLAPVKDLVAYEFAAAAVESSRLGRVAGRLLSREGYSVRPMDLSRWPAEVEMLMGLYNRCWERNWGFVPMTEAEFRHAANDLKLILDPRIFLILERSGEAVGFVGCIPDLNQALAGLDGRLLPFGLFRLLVRKRRINQARIVLLGVAPEARGRGVEAALMTEALTRGALVGYLRGEAGWILEDNLRMRASIESLGVQPTKRYRLYEG